MKRILFIKLTSLGDLIHALPALTDAMSAYPNLKIDWVVDGETQWLTVGRIGFVTVIFVAHVDQSRDNEVVVRIVSARKADRYERQAYEQGYLG